MSGFACCCDDDGSIHCDLAMIFIENEQEIPILSAEQIYLVGGDNG
jgi:hypothetical protein